ncbi:helix-turn-helix domain-containing protein [Alkalihalobacillus sp. 1P02AB]|uniref:response regulator transcription factor n=1 Tax=Alkalihalobacillus sp. 1P02AB TaxID=3132260 RepID=UPI0039A64A85
MKILIIEDEPLIRKGLLKLLTQIKLEHFILTKLMECANAEEADYLLKEQRFDLIFTDIEMNEMNGLNLINKWKGKMNDTQWVIVSGYDRFDYAQQAIQFGVQEYLLKPVTKKKLSETIQRCLQNLEEKNDDFIGPSQVEHFINSLETVIWDIDKKTLEVTYGEWLQQVEDKRIRIKYYNDLLTHILEVLYRRISNKGSRLFQSFHWQIDVETTKEANQTLYKKCLQLIHMIEQQRKGNELDPIEAAKQFIHKNLDQEVSLEEVAKKLGLNPSYFSHLFKKETGETFIAYRIRQRMELAKKLLLKKDVRVTDIPSLIGLNDHPHFTKTFKKYTGQTPSDYRIKMGIN